MLQLIAIHAHTEHRRSTGSCRMFKAGPEPLNPPLKTPESPPHRFEAL